MSRRVLLLLTAAVLVYALQFLPPLIFHDLVIAPSLGEHFGWALPYLAPVMVVPPLAWAAVAAAPVLRGGSTRRASGLSLTLLFFAPFAYAFATPVTWVAVRGVDAIGGLEDDPLLLGMVLPFLSGMILSPVLVGVVLQWWLRRTARRAAAGGAQAEAAPERPAPEAPTHDASGLPLP